ncbi:MAG: biopolymer transporter ExbD [Planctomycetales bacterium]|nr:biopolymer transporter ExbD [Planctomycetales bacterium]MCA9183313.1 biopolymer transporter ExbD [Planctomycetales bacterium]
MAVTLKRGQVLAVLSMTPLIDVVFLLLIFFLVASRLSQEDRELDIPLPSAANAMPMTVEPQEMIVNISQDGAIVVNSQTYDAEKFERMLVQTIADNPLGQSILIRADRRVPLQTPVDVMDICLQAGASYSLSIADAE